MVAPSPEVVGLAVLIATGVLADAIRPKGKIHGALKAAREKRETALDAHAAIPEVKDTLEHVAETVEDIDYKTDRNAHLIREFHADEDVTVSVDDILDDDPVFRGDNGD